MASRTIPTTIRRGFASHQHGVVEPPVLVKKRLNARRIIFNRPRQLNALSMEMVDIMYPYLKTWDESKDVNVIIFEGTGKGLSAGGDVKEIADQIKDPNLHSKLDYQLDVEYELFHYVGALKTPYVAIMDGITMGAGGGLSCPGPFRIATEKTKFAFPETAIGSFCDVGSGFHCSRLDGFLGRYMGLSSRVLKAEDALFAGVATHFVHSSQLEKLKVRLSEVDSPDYDQVNEIIEDFAVKSDHQPEVYTLRGEQRQIIDSCFKYDTVEEIVKALKENGSKFALDTLNTLSARSPSSLKITLESYRRCASLSFKECLLTERQLWRTVSHSHDFMEGVTSQLVTKQAPKWDPPTLEELDLENDIITRYFNANTKRRFAFRNDQDYFLHPFRQYALPSEKEIIDTMTSQKLRTVKDTVEWFMKDRKGKFGVRQKVEDTLDRLKADLLKI